MARKCFISFKAEDASYKRAIQDHLRVDMIDKSLDEPINSYDDDYILEAIRRDYLSDSTVTIHLIGAHSAQNLGAYEQRFIKRELQASLYDSPGNRRSGLLGVVLPIVAAQIFRGEYVCWSCRQNHNCIAVNDATVISEFSNNYYIPHGKCAHQDDDRYCVLVQWDEFCRAPERYIEAAFEKRAHPIANKVRVYPDRARER